VPIQNYDTTGYGGVYPYPLNPMIMGPILQRDYVRPYPNVSTINTQGPRPPPIEDTFKKYRRKMAAPVKMMPKEVTKTPVLEPLAILPPPEQSGKKLVINEKSSNTTGAACVSR
jgi:hypothetical protein